MKKIIMIAISILVLALVFAGCQTEEDSHPVEGSFTFTPDNYPRMGGSLAVLPLGEAITASALSISREETADYILFENSTTWNYEQLVEGNFDILLAYEPSEEAIAYAESQNFEWEMTPIGRDALVFIANADNPVGGLTTQQITDIYTGQITNWSQVGGNDSEIIAYQRNRDSGSQTLFDLFFPLGDQLIDPPEELIVDSMIGLLEAVADYDNCV